MPQTYPPTRRRYRVLLARVLITVVAAVVGLLTAAVPTSAHAPASPVITSGDAVEVVRFVGDGCPKCAEQDQWLHDHTSRHPNLRVRTIEVWQDPAGREAFLRVADELGFPATSVPTTVLGDRVWIGWTDQIAADLHTWIDKAGAGVAVPAGLYGRPGDGTCDDPLAGCTEPEAPSTTVDVPLVGPVDLGDHTLLVSTVIIGFLDGINPCSLWAISVLLTIVVRTSSRRRIVAVGGTFLLVTTAMYGLYMAGIYSALTVATHLVTIQVAVAVVAGFVGVVAVKDYFALNRGVSLSIPTSAKPGLVKRMRGAATHRELGPAMLATTGLAVAVSLLETPCTAGFPVLWTGMLQANGVGPAEAVGLFGAYMAPFLLDEIVVVAVVVATMRAARMQEKHGQLLKLIAGVTMLALAAAMAIDPSIMQSPAKAFGLFGAAFATTAIIHATTSLLRSRPAPSSTGRRQPSKP